MTVDRVRLVVLATAVVSLYGFGTTYAQQRVGGPARFAAPDINKAADQFKTRTERGIFNVDFLVASTIGKANKIQREAQEEANKTVEEINNAVIRQANGDGPASANSVTVLPGVDVRTLNIVNISEGDAIAINR